MRARHILLEFNAPWPVARQRVKRTQAEARVLAEQLIDRVLGGEDFGALALQFSACPSRSEGGDLGRFGPDDMAKRFSDAMRGLQINQLSDPVETEFGYHVIWRLE